MAGVKPSREIAFPFHIGPSGGIAYEEDPGRIFLQHILAIVHTGEGERLMLPNFGSTARDYLFANIDELTATELALRIEAAIQRWEPNIVIRSVSPVERRGSGDTTLAIEIQFSVPPKPEVLSTVFEVGGAVLLGDDLA